MGLFIALIVIFVLIALLIAASFTIVPQYQEGVVLTLGRYSGTKRPGPRLVIPIIQQMKTFDTRERVVDVPRQDIITKDNVLVRVNGIVFYRIANTKKAALESQDVDSSTRNMAQAILRQVVGQHELDELSAPHRLSEEIQRTLEVRTDPWGVKVSNVEIKEVEIDKQMVRVISRQAEAERIRRAKRIEASGELEAAHAFLQAADILAAKPEAMQLRYLATLNTIANERSSTIVFPFPTDLAQMFSGAVRPPSGNGNGNGRG
jgi:regulator of protease activity HflC (stomatin/prohibitin superfamily)